MLEATNMQPMMAAMKDVRDAESRLIKETADGLCIDLMVSFTTALEDGSCPWCTDEKFYRSGDNYEYEWIEHVLKECPERPKRPT